jgi:hypothetical protein
MRSFVEIILWIIIASLVVLVVMNPKGFVAAITSVGGIITGESRILTGAGYANAKAA